MALQSRPDGKVFASAAQANEIEPFPDVLRGWGVTKERTAGIPPMSWFNGAFNRLDRAIQYQLQRGIPEWDATEEYPAGAKVQHAGSCWTAKANNTKSTPGADPAIWEEWAPTMAQVLQAINNVVHSGGLNSSTLDGHDSSWFASAGDLSDHINNRNNPHGVTREQLGAAPVWDPVFQGNPQAPTPGAGDNDNSIATTAFVQATIAAAITAGAGGGFTQSFGENGWCRMPNGFIVQWGRVRTIRGEGSGPNITFPIAFPNACVSVTTADWNMSGGGASQWQSIDCFVQVTGTPGQTAFGTFVQNPGSNANYFEGFLWMAVGF